MYKKHVRSTGSASSMFKFSFEKSTLSLVSSTAVIWTDPLRVLPSYEMLSNSSHDRAPEILIVLYHTHLLSHFQILEGMREKQPLPSCFAAWVIQLASRPRLKMMKQVRRDQVASREEGCNV